ncbi:hypothetical protein P3S68_019722 [Capsicum galapagoense]
MGLFHIQKRLILLLVLLLQSSTSWGWFFSSTNNNKNDYKKEPTNSGKYSSKNQMIKLMSEFSMDVFENQKGDKLVENAKQKMLVPNSCWQRSYQSLFSVCPKALPDEELRSRLSWNLCDCFQQHTGRSPLPHCDAKSPMTNFLKKLDTDVLTIFLKFCSQQIFVRKFIKALDKQRKVFNYVRLPECEAVTFPNTIESTNCSSVNFFLNGVGCFWSPTISCFNDRETPYPCLEIVESKLDSHIKDLTLKVHPTVIGAFPLFSTHQNIVVVSSPSRNGSFSSWCVPLSVFGEVRYTSCYWEWIKDVLARNKETLERNKTYDAVFASLFKYDQRECAPSLL